jgi:hypothetical protein
MIDRFEMNSDLVSPSGHDVHNPEWANFSNRCRALSQIDIATRPYLATVILSDASDRVR